MDVTLSGILTLSNLLHPSNADFPMDVTLSGISTLLKLIQWENADSPMDITLSGILTLFNLSHPSNADFPILTTRYPSISFGIIIVSKSNFLQLVMIIASSSIVYSKELHGISYSFA